MKTDRDLLQQLAALLSKCPPIYGDEATIRDMVTRYQHPPLTMHNRVALRMTVNDLNRLNELMKQVNLQLQPPAVAPELPVEASTYDES